MPGNTLAEGLRWAGLGSGQGHLHWKDWGWDVGCLYGVVSRRRVGSLEWGKCQVSGVSADARV